MDTTELFLAFLCLSVVALISNYIGYRSGYMTAVEERFEEENHNEKY